MFRTDDGAQTWHVGSLGMSVTCAAGAGYNLSFPDATNGWISHVEPTAPFMELAHTTDSGRTWKVLSRDLLQNQGLLGPVVFNGPTRGWIVTTDGHLFETKDGMHWTERALALPPGYSSESEAVGVPMFFGSKAGAVQAYLGRSGQIDVAFYVTSDGGETWRRTSVVGSVTAGSLDTLTVSHVAPVSFASMSAWWLAVPGQHPSLRVTTNSGATWTDTLAEGLTAFGIVLPGDIHVQAALSADSARVGVCAISDASAFVSADGGGHWRRLHPGSPGR